MVRIILGITAPYLTLAPKPWASTAVASQLNKVTSTSTCPSPHEGTVMDEWRMAGLLQTAVLKGGVSDPGLFRLSLNITVRFKSWAMPCHALDMRCSPRHI